MTRNNLYIISISLCFGKVKIIYLSCYSGNPVGLHGEGLSCDQFCAIVENQIENYGWTDQDGKYLLRSSHFSFLVFVHFW